MGANNTVRYSDKDLNEFKELIQDKIEKAQHDLELIKIYNKCHISQSVHEKTHEMMVHLVRIWFELIQID